jgi:hypothetical protein
VSSDLSHNDVTEEDNLLVEAVSLLVRRQRETETWVTEQVCQSQERAAATDRRYADLETRLAGIEQQLSRLVREFEPNRGEPGGDERLARLREQVEGLKSETDGRPVGASGSPTNVPSASSNGPQPLPPPNAVHKEVTESPGPIEPPRAVDASPPTIAAPQPVESPRPAASASTAPAGVTAPGGRAISFWDLLGSTTADRFGLILIGVGLVAVLYAILSQLHLG